MLVPLSFFPPPLEGGARGGVPAVPIHRLAFVAVSRCPDWTARDYASLGDDAPIPMPAILPDAEVFKGNRFLHRRRVRPKAAAAKQEINVPLDP